MPWKRPRCIMMPLSQSLQVKTAFRNLRPLKVESLVQRGLKLGGGEPGKGAVSMDLQKW